MLFFFVICAWGKCAEGEFRPGAFKAGTVELEVNAGKRVTS